LLKGSPIPEFTNNILLFIDDRIGILQEIGRKPEKNITKNSEISLKKFKILGLLGIGGFGTVFKVKHILTDKIYAMKVMNKNYIIKKKYLHYVVSEFEIMKSLAGFPFILDIHFCFQSANYLYLIVDYCPNGDFTKLRKINNLKLFLAEVILAFEYIHNHNIVYRDLKPENILLDSTGHIRVCDFNLAKSGITKDMRTLSFCGSPMYFSPEMVSDNGVNYKCDIYGIGLLMYELATGVPAYTAPNIQALYEKIKKNKINFKVSGLHGDIKDLIEKILVKNPEQRLSLAKIKEHPYFKDIDFDKVLRKEYGKLETEKYRKISESDIEVENDNKINVENNDEFESEKFKLQQKKLDDNKEYSFLDGKISVKEMHLDQKRVMKNYVKDFYYIKKEDMEQTKDFKLETKGTEDISQLIMEQYKFEV
jgi:serine/threonine protein kinase